MVVHVQVCKIRIAFRKLNSFPESQAMGGGGGGTIHTLFSPPQLKLVSLASHFKIVLETAAF